MTDLAIYDMDRTVTRHATYTPFLLHCAAKRAPWRLLAVPLVAASMLLYVAKVIDRGRLKEINHRLLLGRVIHPEALGPLVESFAQATLRNNIRPGARAAIARDKAEGRRVVMATASYRFYARGIAEALGFDDTIGTDTILGIDERVHAKIDGQNCYGPEKLRMIEAWLKRETIKPGKVRFYSDHASDAPVFEWADEAVAVNPHARLARLAAERGWPIEDWNHAPPMV
ncbi:HAD-IB family hydrolase [Sphingomonas sp.]|uniref:HAD family hydrolase n=1 Tax=Sphingomonas sp. TaxID=28214 RepID=UPI00286A14D2|nr:HAD-IB family hydrolase [Sphingomonas sp.]